MRDITIAITAASYSGNKGAAAMLQSSISQLKEACGERLNIHLMSVYPAQDRVQCPHDFVNIVPARPQSLLFLAFPCAVLYRIFRWFPPFRALLLKNKILNAYAGTDLVIDEAGIAFSDNRGWMMNTYAFVCAAVPMLMGVPAVKYAQALGPFQNRYNRFLAKWILPKEKLILARGKYSFAYLQEIGIRDNVMLCADGAFTMPRDEAAEKRAAQAWKKKGFSHMAAVSVSSVVERKCRKRKIDYCKIISEFILYLIGQGYQVFLFANAARIHSKKPRNNDLIIGDAVYEACKKAGCGQSLLWEHREMDAEEISAYIGHCEFLAASRFHAMVFALSRKVPVLLIGWSHKYREVMEQFGLEEYAADYTQLSLEQLKDSFTEFIKHKEQIRSRIARHLPDVQESSRGNIQNILRVLENVLRQQKDQYLNHAINCRRPQTYMGDYRYCRMGYARDPKIRETAASGGMVTALLCSLLQNREIDGAWVVKTAFTTEGALTYHTFIAQTVQQIREASSSVYMKIPWMDHLDELRRFQGRLAVVLTPCMMRAFVHMLEKDEMLRRKIVLKIGLFCSGVHEKQLSEYALDKCRIPRAGAVRLYYRTGHWRGISSVLYKDGSRREFSYTKAVCSYKNAYFFVNRTCLRCRDQFAAASDISFGDVWLSEVKKEPVKYTGCIVRTEKGDIMLKRAQEQGFLSTRHMSSARMLKSQARALTFKYRTGRWNHRLAGWLAFQNRKFSEKHPEWLKRVPLPAVYYYMCLIRVLLSW